MSTYKSQSLFSSGPHRFKVHGLTLRHEVVEQPGVDGAKVIGLGRTARTIEQWGTLHGDSVSELQQRLDAVETLMDGKGWDLVDDLGRTWPRMVMTEFRPSTVRRLGTRYAVHYALGYVQTQPPIGGVL